MTTPKHRRLRRAGSRWRVLVHEMVPTREYGRAHHITSLRPSRKHRTDLAAVHHLPNTELDEVAVGQWLHLEQMDSGVWWMDVAGIRIVVAADNAGRPKHVLVEHDYDVEGCEYEVDGRPAGGQQ